MADDVERIDRRVLARGLGRGLLVALLGVISTDPDSPPLLWSVRVLTLALAIALVVDAEATRRRHPRGPDPHPVRRRAVALGFLALVGLTAYFHGRTLGFVFGGLAFAVALGAWLLTGRQARTG